MSNIVSIRTQVRDPIAIRSACSRLQLREPVYGPTQLFTNTKLSLRVGLRLREQNAKSNQKMRHIP